jgi:hypothetical protein
VAAVLTSPLACPRRSAAATTFETHYFFLLLTRPVLGAAVDLGAEGDGRLLLPAQ